jgi:hypothetical protein
MPLHTLKSLKICSHTVSPYYATVVIEGKPLQMEIDSGAAVSVVNKRDFEKLSVKLRPTSCVLTTYSQEQITPLGVCSVNVEYNNQSQKLDLFVLDNLGAPPLLGRSCLDVITLDWKCIKGLRMESVDRAPPTVKIKLNEMLNKH